MFSTLMISLAPFKSLCSVQIDEKTLLKIEAELM